MECFFCFMMRGSSRSRSQIAGLPWPGKKFLGTPSLWEGMGSMEGEEQDKRWFSDPRKRSRKRREINCNVCCEVLQCCFSYFNLSRFFGCSCKQKPRTEMLARVTRHMLNLFDKYNRIWKENYLYIATQKKIGCLKWCAKQYFLCGSFGVN